MIAGPIFIFYKDQMIVTDKTEITERVDPDFLEGLQAFDASGRPLKASRASFSIALAEGESPARETEPKKKILDFWHASGNSVRGLENMALDELIKTTLEWLRDKEWKTYRRGSKLFWTMMIPCGLIPFAVGLFKIPMTHRAFGIYMGCFAASMLLIAWLHRKIYPKPPFPEAAKTAE